MTSVTEGDMFNQSDAKIEDIEDDDYEEDDEDSENEDQVGLCCLLQVHFCKDRSLFIVFVVFIVFYPAKGD